MVGKTELVRSVVLGMLVYSMIVYKWPKKLLHKIDMLSNNFICSGDSQKTSLTTAQWKKMCKPLIEGGIGVRMLKEFNDTGLHKLGCELIKKMINTGQGL